MAEDQPLRQALCRRCGAVLWDGEPCPVCGSQPKSDPVVDAEWLDATAMPAADVFRFWWSPATTLASERFVEVLRSMGDTGIQVKEVTVGRPTEAGARL
jgi:hypothetical protein